MSRHHINILLTAGFIGSELVFLQGSEFLLSILLVTGGLFLTILGFGIFHIRMNYFLHSVNQLNSDKCLLTFDDGPDQIYTPKILNTLDKHDVGAIFFVIGSKIKANTAIVESINASGHSIGNHSFNHSNAFALKSTSSIVKELTQTEAELGDLSKGLFRPPIGITNPNIARGVKQVKLKCIGWSLRSFDTIIKTKSQLLDRLLKRTKKGDIVLFHANLALTAEVLEEYIIRAKENGIIFVSKEEVKSLHYA